MAINLATKYSKEIANAFTLRSVVDGTTNKDYDFTGVKTLNVYTPVTQGLADYQRTGTSRYGTPTELQDTMQELMLTRDRSFSITIDKGNNSEQMGAKEASRILSIEMNEQAIPEMDKYEFEFRNVSFKYPKAENYALKNLTLKLNAGERLAVVGLNGAGKSTFIKLLLRLYEPTEGEILLNGVNIRDYNKRSYYSVFAPVFQEVELFAFPLAENVSMQSPEKTDRKRAEECLVSAGFGDKLAELPNGVDTEILKIIHDDGVDLSGGEKQKLALARALYKGSPVVVLDEPTAALDAIAESKLYNDFDRLIGGKTAVYISHRLSSTQFCSNIALFKDGTLCEYGTHESLLEKDGAYAELFRLQAQYYVEEEAANV